MIRKLSLTAAAAVLAASPVLADTYVIDKGHSEVENDRIRAALECFAQPHFAVEGRPDIETLEPEHTRKCRGHTRVVGSRGCWLREQRTGQDQAHRATGAGEIAEVADADEAAWQHMLDETP